MEIHVSSLLLLILSTSLLHIAANDTAALVAFRSQADIHGALLSNWTTAATACSANWVGIHCTNNRVTAVSLPFLNLCGPIAALDQLRLLDLRGNRLNGTLTPLAQCINLKFVYLSGNDFSGEIPPELSSLHRLLRLNLSGNNLRGPIPAQFSNLSRLLTLHLDNNELSGKIPIFLASLPQLKQLNLSNNELSGMLPEKFLLRYGISSFSGNEGLCGKSPLPNCSFTSDHDQPLLPPQIVPSNPSLTSPSKKHRGRLSSKEVIALVLVNAVVVMIVAAFAAVCCCGKAREREEVIRPRIVNELFERVQAPRNEEQGRRQKNREKRNLIHST